MPTEYKIPQSVLVVVYTASLDVLLLRRTDTEAFWQSVTGSRASVDEPWVDTAARELMEETGLSSHAPGVQLTDWGMENVYEIYPRWRARYAPGVSHNTERVFGLRLPQRLPITLSPREHNACAWWQWREAADRCASPSNAEAILWLPRLA